MGCYFCIAHAPHTCWDGILCLLLTHSKSASFCLGYRGDIQQIKLICVFIKMFCLQVSVLSTSQGP